MTRARMQLSSTTITRIALLIALSGCGFSLWLAYQLSTGSSSSSRKLKAERPADSAAAVGAPTAKQQQQQQEQQPAKQGAGQREDTIAAVPSCKVCQEQIAVYERVNASFLSGGLDLPTIRAIQPWFHGLQGSETPWPRSYVDFPEPLPKGSVRLLVIPLEDAPTIAAAAAVITGEVLALLPASVKAFCNARTNYHCTVFHTSHPTDTRPDPFRPDGGLPPSPGPPGTRPGPSQDLLDAETEAVRRLVQASHAPQLVLERVVMANSGTLLLTWVDPSGHVTDLRKRLRTTFPGACAKQATIIHTSLMRLLPDVQLEPGTVQAIGRVCDSWTAKLKGKVLVPSGTWWVNEHEFSTIVGDRVRIRYGAGQ